MTLTGFGNGLAFPMTILIVQRYTSDRLRGRAFTVIISIHSALLGLAMVAVRRAHGVGRRTLDVRRRRGLHCRERARRRRAAPRRELARRVTREVAA